MSQITSFILVSFHVLFAVIVAVVIFRATGVKLDIGLYIGVIALMRTYEIGK